jgi:hypothetical protein
MPYTRPQGSAFFDQARGLAQESEVVYAPELFLP